MTTAAEMIRTYPADLGQVDRDALVRCIEECMACAQACRRCEQACRELLNALGNPDSS